MDTNNNSYHKNGIYYVGQNTTSKNIHCNSYLLVEEDMIVLFEPGSVIDYEDVKKNITDIVPLEAIDFIFVSHPDPDLVSSIPLFEKAGLDARIICDWKTYEILYFYGIKSKPFYVDRHEYMLGFDSGRILRFIPAPFAHYSGNVIAYDETNHTLFSGDLFGGYSKDWTLYADEDYHEAMATYHENYMPSSDFIKPVMKHLLKLNVETILPQHGSIIEGPLVRKSILFLYNLNFYNSSYVVNDVINNRRDYNFITILNQFLSRLKNIFPEQEILDVFEGSTIQIDPELFEIVSEHERKYLLWNNFFSIIYNKKGNHWLSMVETLVNKITRIHHIKKPEVYDVAEADKLNLLNDILSDKEKLMEQIDELNALKNKQEDQLSRCSITGLRYSKVLKRLLVTDLSDIENEGIPFGVISVFVDNMNAINDSYSDDIGDETLRIVAIKIQEIIGNNTFVFRHSGPNFYVYLPEALYPKVKQVAYSIRNEISQSDSFVEQISLSVSVVGSKEIVSTEPVEQAEEVFHLLDKRLDVAKSYGGGRLIDQIFDYKSYSGHVLLIDEDDINRNILLRVFKDVDYEVVIAKDVYEALNILEKTDVDVIISEINLSKMDGFALKRNLNMDSKFASIPFIMVSHNKNRETVVRANQLDVDFIVKKPFYPEEIVGLVLRLRKKALSTIVDA